MMRTSPVNTNHMAKQQGLMVKGENNIIELSACDIVNYVCIVKSYGWSMSTALVEMNL